MTYQELFNKIKEIYPLITQPSKDELIALLQELRQKQKINGYVTNVDLLNAINNNFSNTVMALNDSIHTTAMVNIAQEILDLLDEE